MNRWISCLVQDNENVQHKIKHTSINVLMHALMPLNAYSFHVPQTH